MDAEEETAATAEKAENATGTETVMEETEATEENAEVGTGTADSEQAS